MKICKQCGKEVKSKFGEKFCSKSCATRFNNNKRLALLGITTKGKSKTLLCTSCNETFIGSIHTDINKALCFNCRHERDQKLDGICQACGNPCRKDKATCCIECCNYLLSLKRSKKIQESGTSNFKTKQELFSYKIVQNILLDSQLERAAVIYLVDIFKADKVERYRNILNFWEGVSHRTFNPDFYVKKGNQIFIVEVKMRWSKNSLHDYNRTIPLKKIALEKFCLESNYKMIWLDYDYDKRFKKIYLDVLKSVH